MISRKIINITSHIYKSYKLLHYKPLDDMYYIILNKNDLPGEIMKTFNNVYNYTWSHKNVTRQNDLPADIDISCDYYICLYKNNAKIYKYNGYAYYYTNLKVSNNKNMEYKFINGICIEFLKKEVSNG